MTSLIAWIAKDSRSISSLNFASDSRIYWDKNDKYEMGKKLFFSQNHPEIFGFTGDVLICYFILNHLINLIDITNLIKNCNTINEKNEAIFNEIKKIIDCYPRNRIRNFNIYYGTRLGKSNQCKFGLLRIEYKNNKLSKEELNLLEKNYFIDGSGKKTIEEMIYQYKKKLKENILLSREIFSAFCDSINSNLDNCTNNIAQVVSLYRDHSAQPIGYVSSDEKIFLYGIECMQNYLDNPSIQFRDSLYQRCNLNATLIENAQRQPKIFPILG